MPVNAAIILTGLGAGVPNPGTYVELDFAQGPVAGTGSPRKVLLIGNKSSAGSATADTVIYGPDTAVPCQTENDVITLFGAGSQLHRMFIRFTAVNKVSLLYFIAVLESAGAQATTTETITLAATATANANHRTWWADQFVDTAISNGVDTKYTIAVNVAAAVNQMTRWGITATALSGIVTYTAVNKGPEGNWEKVQAAIQQTAVSGVSTSLTANTFLSGGTTPDTNVNALATIQPAQFYYLLIADSDATNAGRVSTQVLSNAAALIGIRQRFVMGFADTLANAITTATGLNNPRGELVWNGGSAVDLPPPELSATLGGVYSLLEQGSPFGVFRKNFSLFPSQPNDPASWPVIPGRAGVAGALTFAQITSCLNNGISPISVNTVGLAYLVKRCTTRSLNGSVADYRVRDAHKVSVCDYWCDDAAAITQLQFGGRDLLPDPAIGQPPPPPIAVTPRLWGNALKALVQNYGNVGQWTYLPGVTPQPGQSPADVINAAFVGPQIELNPNTRMSVSVPLAPVSIADQFAVLALQVT